MLVELDATGGDVDDEEEYYIAAAREAQAAAAATKREAARKFGKTLGKMNSPTYGLEWETARELVKVLGVSTIDDVRFLFPHSNREVTHCRQLDLPVTVGGVVVIRNLGTALQNFQYQRNLPEVMMMAKQILEDVPDEERSLFQKLAKENCFDHASCTIEDCDASRMWDGLPAELRNMSDEDWDGWAAGENKSVADFKAVLRHAASLNLDDGEEDEEED